MEYFAGFAPDGQPRFFDSESDAFPVFADGGGSSEFPPAATASASSASSGFASSLYYTMPIWNPYTQVIMKTTIQLSR